MRKQKIIKMKYLKNFIFLLGFTCCLYACSDNNTSTAETAVNNNDSSDIAVEQPGMAEFEFFQDLCKYANAS